MNTQQITKPRSRPTARRAARFVAATISGGILATTAMAGSAGVTGAVAAPSPSGVVTYTSHVYLSPQPDGTSRFLLVANSCELQAAGGANMPCSLVGSGVISSAAGGTARGVIVTRDRVITIDETFHFTGPTTSVGSGPAMALGSGGLQRGSFVGNFVATPTANANVLDDSGTITVTL